MQMDQPRGFATSINAPLDMRMNPAEPGWFFLEQRVSEHAYVANHGHQGSISENHHYRTIVSGCPTAAALVNVLDAESLTKIFKVYGEDRNARKIAEAIVNYR